MVRDDEIKRLVYYAKGLGLVVRVRSYIPYSRKAAEHISLPNGEAELVLFISPRDSKMDTVLSLIHEIGHHHDYIHRGRSFDRNEDEDELVKLGKPGRLKILQNEIRGTRYWNRVYVDTGCTFPKWKLFCQMEFDLWQYYHIYRTGKLPTKSKRVEKMRHLIRKYKYDGFHPEDGDDMLLESVDGEM